MDLRMWRKVLLHWVIECQFIDHNFITLEQSDIEAFFSIYIRNAQAAQEAREEEDETEAEQAQPVELRSPLAVFLREHYPEFSAHMNSQGHLVTSDYVFVYTLLLQYSCVKRPSMIFHNICQRLPAPMQNIMANLLDQTTKEPQLTRKNLRQIIANVEVEREKEEKNKEEKKKDDDSPVSPCRPSSSSLTPEEVAMDNAPCSSSSTAATSPQPPGSTPQQAYHRDRLRVQVSGNEMQMPAPSTPRTELLEQRTRELRGVRAQLEVVRYEKAVLEEQQLEREEQIRTLNRECTATRAELAQLKNAAQNVEEVDVNAECTRNECDQLKRSLQREISEKEAIITESSDRLQDLYLEKSDLAEQLRAAGQNLLVCVDRIHELEMRVEDLNRIASLREEKIFSLERDKQELDQCLQEAREELHNRREVLNASSDLLNCSLSPNTTPENLASSVIDKQLREKEHENAELREELQMHNDSLMDLNKTMVGFLQRHNIDQEEDLLAVALEDQTAPSISMIKSTFLEAVEKATRLQEQCDSQAANIEELLQKSLSLSRSLDEQGAHLVTAKARIDELDEAAAEKNRFHASELEKRQKQCRHTHRILEAENRKLIKEREDLEVKIMTGNTHMDEIKEQLAEKETQMADLGVRISELRDKNESLETRISSIDAERISQESRLQEAQRYQEYLRSKYDQCRTQLRDSIEKMDYLSSQLDTLKLLHAQKLEELDTTNNSLTVALKLNDDEKEKEQDQLHLKINELREEKEQVQHQLQLKIDEKAQLQQTIDELSQQQSNLRQETDSFLNRITGLIRADNAISSMEISSTGSGELCDRFEDVETLLKKQTLVLDTLETRVNELLLKLDELQRRNAEILNESQELVTKCKHDEQQREQLTQTLELTVEKLREEVDLQDAEIAMRDQQVAGMEKLVKKAMGNIEARLLKISPDSEFPGCTDVTSPQQINQWMDHFFDLHDQITASRDTLETRYKANSKIADQLAQSKEQLEQQVQLLQDKVQANDQGPVVKQLNDTISNLEQVNDKLSKDNIKLHSLQLEMSQSLAKNASEVERRSSKIAQLEASDRRRASDLYDCRKKQDEQKAELRAKDEKMAQMKEMYEKQIEELKGNCDQRCKDLEKETEGGNQDLLGNLKENEDKLAKQADEHNQLLKATKDECELRCQELEKQLAEKDEEQSKLKTLEAECQQRCQELEKQLAEKESQSADLVREHETAVQFIKAELEEARYQENQMRIQDKELRKTIETHKQLLRESSSDLQDARLQEQNLRQTIATHKQLMMEGGGDSSKELSSLRSKLQDAERRAEQLKIKLDKQQKELSEAKAASSSTKESLSLRTKQEDELKEKLDQQQEELSELKAAMESAESRSAELQTLYDDATEELISLSNKLLEEGKRADQLKLELNQQEKELLEGKAQLASAESSTKELVSLRDKLEDEQKLTDQLRDDLNKQHLELGTEASRRAELNVLYDSSQKELLDIRTKLQDEQKLRDQLEAELNQEKKELSEAKAQLASIASRTADQHKSNDASKEELLSLQTRLQNEQRLTNELKVQLSTAKLELEGYASGTVELNELYDRSKQELFRIRTKLEDEEKHSERLKRELDRQSVELATSQSIVDERAERQQEQTQNQAELESRAANLMLERDALQREIHLVKERLVREEREFQVKLANLEDDIETLEAQRDRMKADLSDASASILKKDENIPDLAAATAFLHEKDENIRELTEKLSKQDIKIDTQSMEMAETNRQLTEKANEVLELQERLAIEVAASINLPTQQSVDELQQCLESEIAERKLAQQQIAELNERLADVQQELDGTRLVHDAYQFELEEKTREIEANRNEAEERIRNYRERVEQLEQKLAQCNDELAELRLANDKESSRQSDLCATYSKADAPESDVNLGHLSQEEAVQTNKLALDCQILQAKYRDAKDEIQRCEQKIKDQRLEMEGKLDKMKSKMRSLYTAEVTRMKEKQERDAAKSSAEMEALTAQNAKYEEHTRKLSNQIVRLNEKVLEQQKQHAIISTKLRHLQMQPAVCEAKPISSSSAPAASNEDWQPFKRPNAPSSNLAMEDEEGEVFNNTYLTDLKLGRVPTDMTAEELIYRNSLQPPHLKSTYAAQYDLGSQDEDLKDGPHSLDDSMSALLSSSSTGARKKSMGTHYKRPGPPTPSKNGGRLSFGSSEPPREILREFGGDHNSNTSKTPARFKFLTQRFSVGSSTLPRDEVSILPQRKRSTLLTGIQRRRFRQAVGLFCTSTPRKSRSYYDQQRLIRASDADVASEADVEEDEEDQEEEEEEMVMEEAGADQQGTPHLSTAALLALTKGHTRRLTGQGQAKTRKSRASLCLHGNIFCAKSRPVALKVVSTGGKRLQQRRKLRQERMGRFDQARHLDQMRLSANLTYSATSPESPENNNYSLHNRNAEQKPLMGQTVVLESNKRSLAATFSVEQHSGETLEQRQFESENQLATTWAMAADETQEVWHFEQLCQETESTAPFQLQPLHYKPPDELKLPQLVRSCSNITDASCTTNMTSTSSRGSCTTYSMASVHMTPIPHINITYVQPAGSRKSTPNRSLTSQCRQILGRLSLGERLIVGLALMAIVLVILSFFQLEHRLMVLALTVVLAAMILVLLTTRT
ncbi:hypothetical protein KR084_006734 [Drosophila pseudotakahashii]|nr:hypothetical protein KR084_006734 [Drosophila pseudotakahashii]